MDAYVGSDNINAGVICGEKLIEAAPDGGQVVILECTTQNSIIDRINGFEETIAGKGFEVVERSETGGKKDEAKTQMARILKEQDHITAVMCGNDQIALGALEAIEEAGRSEDDDLQRGWFSQTQTGACQGWQPCCGDRGTVSN